MGNNDFFKFFFFFVRKKMNEWNNGRTTRVLGCFPGTSHIHILATFWVSSLREYTSIVLIEKVDLQLTVNHTKLCASNWQLSPGCNVRNTGIQALWIHDCAWLGMWVVLSGRRVLNCKGCFLSQRNYFAWIWLMMMVKIRSPRNISKGENNLMLKRI